MKGELRGTGKLQSSHVNFLKREEEKEEKKTTKKQTKKTHTKKKVKIYNNSKMK